MADILSSAEPPSDVASLLSAAGAAPAKPPTSYVFTSTLSFLQYFASAAALRGGLQKKPLQRNFSGFFQSSFFCCSSFPEDRK